MHFGIYKCRVSFGLNQLARSYNTFSRTKISGLVEGKGHSLRQCSVLTYARTEIQDFKDSVRACGPDICKFQSVCIAGLLIPHFHGNGGGTDRSDTTDIAYEVNLIFPVWKVFCSPAHGHLGANVLRNSRGELSRLKIFYE